MRWQKYTLIFLVTILIGTSIVLGVWWWLGNELFDGFNSIRDNQLEDVEVIFSNRPEEKEIRTLVYQCDGASWSDALEASLLQCNDKMLIPGFTFNVTRKFFQENQKLTRMDLENQDVLIIPGGYLYKMYRNWEAEDIRQWIKNGGGYVGICAGEILAIEGEVQDSIFGHFIGLQIAPQIQRQTTDWVGARNVRMTDLGTVLLGLSGDQTVYEWNGSSLVFKNDQLDMNVASGKQPFIFATYHNNSLDPEPPEQGGDLWKQEFDGTAAVVGDYYGSGRIILSGPHPEYPKEQGKLQSARLIGAMVKWASKDDTEIPYVIGRENVLQQDYLAFKMGAVSSLITEDAYISTLKVFIRYGQGKGALGVYSHDAARNAPGRLLAEKAFNLPREMVDYWQGITFDRELFLKKGSVIWLAWAFENMIILSSDSDATAFQGDFGDSIYLETNLTWQELTGKKFEGEESDTGNQVPGAEEILSAEKFLEQDFTEMNLPEYFPEDASINRRIFAFYTLGQRLNQGEVVMTE